MSKEDSVAGGPRARQRGEGDEAGEVKRDDMMQAGSEAMSGPQYSFFPTSIITELWVGTCQLG